LSSKKRFYILFVSRDEDGNLNKVPVPLHYAYVFVAAAAIGLFTITGLAGSYSRMLIKTARFNQLRQDHDSLRKDYATLEQQARQKDVQAASLGSLATEISALYGLTASKLTLMHEGVHGGGMRARALASAAVVKVAATAPLKDAPSASGLSSSGISNDGYYKSLDSFYALRTQAMSGDAMRVLAGGADLERMRNPLMPGHDFGGDENASAYAPTLWPITGPISSSFGEREDPILGNGEGEFHPGLDISAPQGTPIHATADGVVVMAGMENGYGRLVEIDHGHGVMTRYGHMSGFAVTAGQTVARGDVVGYVGHTGRTTGNHVHYEVRINGTPVNPHKYLRVTLAQFGAGSPAGL
jgi:murein DD-endopeptidase MepM/ murein hydrolase activator NlpD